MTLEELKTSKEGDRVCLEGRRVVWHGVVHAADSKCIELWWRDGTSSLIWFSHCADGRDTRHQLIKRDTTKRRKS